MERTMKTNALLITVALVASAFAMPAFASGDVSADRHWRREAPQATARQSTPTSHQHDASTSAVDARKVDDAMCGCSMKAGAHVAMTH
jgi:hypothetical protein